MQGQEGPCQCGFGSLSCSKESWFLRPELLTPALGPWAQDRKEGELPLIQAPPGRLFRHVSSIHLTFSPPFSVPTTSPVLGSTSQLPGITIIRKQSKKLGGYLIFHGPLGSMWFQLEPRVIGVDTVWPQGRNTGPEGEAFRSSSTKHGCGLGASLSQGPGWVKTKKHSLPWGFRIFSSGSITWSDASPCWSCRSEDHTFCWKTARSPWQRHFLEMVEKQGGKAQKSAGLPSEVHRKLL